MSQEIKRKGIVTFKGGPLTLVGQEIKVGSQAPNFKLCSTDMKDVTLDDFNGKVLVLSVVPSLDTSVCDLQGKRFNEEAKKLPQDIVIVIVSCDLPFAQARWKKEASCSNVETLSDYKERSFGKDYGVLIDELKLLSRSVFIIGKDKKIYYADIVSEVTTEPNYQQALTALKSLN